MIAGEVTFSLSGDAVTVNTTALTDGYILASNVQDGFLRASFAGGESRTGHGPVLEVVFDEPPSSLSLERVSLNEGRIPIRIGERKTPNVYRLSQNYPNPFNPETTISYNIAQRGSVRLSVYALTGQLVRTLVDGERAAGSYSVMWDGMDDAGRGVASGVYVCRLKTGDYQASQKMLLLR